MGGVCRTRKPYAMKSLYSIPLRANFGFFGQKREKEDNISGFTCKCVSTFAL